MKVVCAPNPSLIVPSVGVAFGLLAAPSSAGVGRVGVSMPLAVRRARVSPTLRAWDFLSIALAVIAADHGCQRRRSPDGWTREIELTVSIVEPEAWAPHSGALADAFGFLTGDVWSIQFEGGGVRPPAPVKQTRRSRAVPAGDMVCLLSGGLDSLVGAIDLVAQGKQPVFVSQIASGDSTRQRHFARAIAPTLPHLQFSHAVRPPGLAEHSQRARSIIFLAYGLLVASSLPESDNGAQVELAIPENGFISLNVPLTALRVGSLSTRTTHPYLLGKVQQVWDAMGLDRKSVV